MPRTNNYSKQDAIADQMEEQGVGKTPLATQDESNVPLHPLTGKPYSRRGLRDKGLSNTDASPFQQVRRFRRHLTSNDQAEGAYAYYLRPDGATISDVLIVCPNGGRPEIPPGTDQRTATRRRKLGTNAEYYRGRNAAKGFEYVGPKLTPEAIKRLVEILEENREDEIDFIDEKIAEAEELFKTSSDPAKRDLERDRISALNKRRMYLTQKLDVDAMVDELNRISRAHQLASLPPNVLQVMTAMIGEAEQKMVNALLPKKVTGAQAASALGNVDFGDD
ncbi:MAG: hypothetical protein IPI95_15605 [Flavobacteriales bacterium]|nr:hypothetical protein [Flavobacteriales bacterium]MBK7288384.1 hypothetical protein [Flavobacteriales bacterium]